MTSIRVPATSCNMGPGFDSHGLALKLYLTIKVRPATGPAGSFLFEGEGADELDTASEENLIHRSMRFAAAREGVDLPPADLNVYNEIPLARGLGSSAAAIVAGLKVFETLTGIVLDPRKLLEYAGHIEGHFDNVAAALLGSFVISSRTETGVLAARLDWPPQIRAVVVIPDYKLRTTHARGVLPGSVSHEDAVFNVQRASLMIAAVVSGRNELIAEAMQDRLHQPYRQVLVPGMAEALSVRNLPGLLGVALSGSGPSVLALAIENFREIGESLKQCFTARGQGCSYRVLDIEKNGATTKGRLTTPEGS